MKSPLRKFPATIILAPVVLLLLGSASASAATSETYYFFVFSNPVAGHEDEYNRWYDQQHAPDVVAIPGFVSAKVRQE